MPTTQTCQHLANMSNIFATIGHLGFPETDRYGETILALHVCRSIYADTNGLKIRTLRFMITLLSEMLLVH